MSGSNTSSTEIITSQIPIQATAPIHLKSHNPFSIHDLPTKSEKRLIWLFAIMFILTFVGIYLESTWVIFKFVFIPLSAISLYANQTLILMRYIDDKNIAGSRKRFNIAKLYFMGYALALIGSSIWLIYSPSFMFTLMLLSNMLIVSMFLLVSGNIIFNNRSVTRKNHRLHKSSKI